MSEHDPFLKWAGGKRRQLDYLARKLPDGKRLVEPFVGAGSVFLGTDYDAYLLADTNQDLIDLYHTLMDDGQEFVRFAKAYFDPANNFERRYYDLRDQFNELTPGPTRAALFLYLNRHGYGGLCRYNADGNFNVPYGKYKQPYFPEAEMGAFYRKAKGRDVRIVRQDFKATFRQLRRGDVVYCDPPYNPISKTANFTQYTMDKFTEEDQNILAHRAQKAAERGIPIIINNHSHPEVNALYRYYGASLAFKRRTRAINSNLNGRRGVVEMTAAWNIGPAQRRAA